MLEFKQKGREMESKLKRTHVKEYKEIKQLQLKFDYSLMSKHLKRSLAAGQDYAYGNAELNGISHRHSFG